MTESWMVRAGQGGVLIDDFIEKDMVTLGWAEIGDLTEVVSVDEIKKLLREKCGYTRNAAIGINAGQISRFKNEIVKGELVVTYDPSKRIYWIGEIISDYIYDQSIEEHPHPHIRKVNWKHSVTRDQLSTSTKNSLGSISTIFKISSEATEELLNPKSEVEDEENNLNILEQDIQENSIEFIKDKIAKLDWDELQDLVAGILRAMGYKTLVSPKGADRGKDIIASPDGLGLEDPKIVVEVKHRKNSPMGSQEVRSLLGGLRANSKALFVSTGGFTKDAKYEAERAIYSLMLIDLDLLVELITQYYDACDSETKTLLPLKKIYWPL